MGDNVELQIPLDLLREFKKDDRVVVRWLVLGKPVVLASILKNPEVMEKLEKQGFELFLTPKKGGMAVP